MVGMLALTGCSTSTTPVVAASSQAVPDVAPADGTLLVAARHPVCLSEGLRVMGYLTTGDNGGDPNLDLDHATERAMILASPTDAQAALLRQAADQVIMSCDDAMDGVAPVRE
jgi:hypothetical protein